MTAKFGTRISMPGPPQMFDENYVLSGLETSITMSCLLESAGLALQQDAREPWLLAHCACLLWKRPTGIVKEDWERSVRSVLPTGGAPWVAERHLQCIPLSDDRSGVGQAEQIWGALRKVAGKENAEAICGKVFADAATGHLTKRLVSRD